MNKNKDVPLSEATPASRKQIPSASQFTILGYYSFLLFAFWVVFCWQGITTAVGVWWGNEIFNHCFFIVPGALYLMYLKRAEMLSRPIRTSYAALLLIVPAMLLYVIGLAGDIRLFMHAATFSLLPALIWFLLGTAAARVVLFPLFFMLFSVPLGEQLIPYLQEIAADGAVALLHASGVPLFRSGLYIEIPQGRFLVAEACSGVSFFIASFVIGSLYAYLNLVSTKRRGIFVAISLIFPVLANIVRVYGIIYIAYLTDMEYAAGADHLIYGWFFFAFVIICLLGIGELMREKQLQYNVTTAKADAQVDIAKRKMAVVLALFSGVYLWAFNISNSMTLPGTFEQPVFSEFSEQRKCDSAAQWSPELLSPTALYRQGVTFEGNCSTVIVEAWYDGVDNELVSALNRPYSPNKWSRISWLEVLVETNTHNVVFKGENITSPTGVSRYVTSWYFIDGRIFESGVKAKLYQVYLALMGRPISGSYIFVSSIDENTLDKVVTQVVEMSLTSDYVN